ncbi:MAG TPA: HlyD family efflux transporter periplasmic adaptor subunit, partial [Planctomycetes bacterium]|nr:HlyD family efflux transporter periplasmic adaptor subunit [Planctomycetota bacterium]
FMLLLVVLLVGCGQDQQDGQNQSPGQDQQAEQTRQRPATRAAPPAATPLQNNHAQLTFSSLPASAVTEEGWIVVTNCNVALIKDGDVDIPAQEAGVLMKFHVREGSVVEAEADLAQIDDADAQVRLKSAELELSVAKKEALNDINVRAAKKAFQVAEAEWEQSLEVNKNAPGAIPKTQIKREELTKDRAKLQIEVAELEFEVAALTSEVRKQQVEVGGLSVERRRVKSPIAGVVEQRYKDVGEWVQPGEPIMQVIRMDQLRIEGFLRADEVFPTEVVNKDVSVEVVFKKAADDAGNQLLEPFAGKLTFVSNQVQAGGEYKVWAEVKNRQTPDGQWVLRPGMVATMKIKLAD